jgi:hypothetical protein
VICHEPDNPYDELALRVDNDRGEIIGYIAKDSWLRGAIHDEGKGCVATIKSIGTGSEGLLGVVLDVTLANDAILVRSAQTGVGKSSPVLGSWDASENIRKWS